MKGIFKYLTAGLILYPLCATAFSYVAGTSPGSPPEMSPVSEQADLIRVDKSERLLELLRSGQVIRSYTISLGDAPEGHKVQQGDERTPEGTYRIDWRNPNSVAYLSLHISYPNTQDRARAAAAGVDPGGDIMIHGILNGWGFLGPLQRFRDWTNGCIAVTDAEMREIWSLVPDGTAITIQQ